MRLILLGLPGAGKGTQAKKISAKFKIPHISTGDILRNELKKNTQLGIKANEYMKQGKLVPDELIIEIIKNEIGRVKKRKDFLLDGFPRTLQQARMLDDMLSSIGQKIDKVLNIKVDRESIIKRLSNRMVCHSCNNICSLNDDKSLDGNTCPECGGVLYKRKDDEIDIIKQRLDVYEKQTKPLENYYREKDLLLDIDGSGSENEVTERVLALL
ncbi:MAG: adenylate kinase [Actinobacteria bacterium]|nr:adenylate kinase [Actinomycetota bacterium]MBM3712828.1 adenylate kinase [Actinomycetota bacterium]